MFSGHVFEIEAGAYARQLFFQNASGQSVVDLYSFQFGAGLISTQLAVRGVNGSDQEIRIQVAQNFNAAAWTFTNWTVQDLLVFNGGSSANLITGSNRNDFIHGGVGNDTADRQGRPGLSLGRTTREFAPTAADTPACSLRVVGVRQECSLQLVRLTGTRAPKAHRSRGCRRRPSP